MSSVTTEDLARWFDPAAVGEDALAMNEAMAQLPGLPLDIDAIRSALATQMAATAPGGHLYRSPRAEVIEIPGSKASIRLLRPSGCSTAVVAHVHGGGWSFGAADEHDQALEEIADELGVVVASVEYRLAPEHPYPAPRDDVLDALAFLTERGADLVSDSLSTPSLVVIGESAGANLALSAACRMKEQGGPLPNALVLFYGAFDLSMTPSQRHYGRTGLVNTDSLAYFYSLYAQANDPRDPEISPLFDVLSGLPPTQLLVGTDDPLLDDTMFLHARLLAANVEVDLHVAPGGGHGFNYFPIEAAREGSAASLAFIRAVISD